MGPSASTAGAQAVELPFTGLDLRGPLAAGLVLLGPGMTLRAAGALLRG